MQQHQKNVRQCRSQNGEQEKATKAFVSMIHAAMQAKKHSWRNTKTILMHRQAEQQ